MKKKKKQISLTAKQRKEQRDKELMKNEPKKTLDELSEDERVALEAEKEAKKRSRKKTTVFVSIVLSAVLALGSLTTGVVLFALSRIINNEKTNPTAIVTLYSGEKIEIELFWKENTPGEDNSNTTRAVIANLIYLAENNFYNDTIFNCTSHGFLAMSGYTSKIEDDKVVYNHRGNDYNYVSQLSGFLSPHKTESKFGSSNYKLGYRIKSYTKNDPGDIARRGHVAFMSQTSQGSSTSFLLMGLNNPNLKITGSTLSSLTYFGKMTDKSLNVIDRLLALEDREKNKYIADWDYANPETTEGIKIKTVEIKDLNKKLKNNILNDFEEFVLKSDSEMEGALKGYISWSTKTDSYFDPDK